MPSGVYSLVARATLPDKNAPPVLSKPLTVRVGDVSLHRAINLGSPQRVIVDGLTFEPVSGAPNLSVNARRIEQREMELTPPPLDGQQGALLRSGLSYRDGVVATLLQVPLGTAQGLLGRAHRKMREHLADFARAHGFSSLRRLP